jgi:hypothetical protein
MSAVIDDGPEDIEARIAELKPASLVATSS